MSLQNVKEKLDTNCFDVCHARYVLLHIRDWEQAIENIGFLLCGGVQPGLI